MYEQEIGLDAYHQTNTEAQAATAEPHQLVIMLIDGFLEELTRAEGHIAGHRYEQKGKAIGKCLEIIAGLDSALDLDNGGQVAQNLHDLYNYCADILYKASLNNDPDGFKSVFTVMDDLRIGWQALGRNAT